MHLKHQKKMTSMTASFQLCTSYCFILRFSTLVGNTRYCQTVVTTSFINEAPYSLVLLTRKWKSFNLELRSPTFIKRSIISDSWLLALSATISKPILDLGPILGNQSVITDSRPDFQFHLPPFTSLHQI